MVGHVTDLYSLAYTDQDIMQSILMYTSFHCVDVSNLQSV
jgi:hypothetical protein